MDAGAGDARSDMYLLGRLLTYLLSGGSETNPEHLSSVQDGIKAFLRRCTEEDPVERFSGYTFFLRSLSDLIRDLGGEIDPDRDAVLERTGPDRKSHGSDERE